MRRRESFGHDLTHSPSMYPDSSLNEYRALGERVSKTFAQTMDLFVCLFGIFGNRVLLLLSKSHAEELCCASLHPLLTTMCMIQLFSCGESISMARHNRQSRGDPRAVVAYHEFSGGWKLCLSDTGGLKLLASRCC